jgi:hypothetical protein
VFTSRLPPKKPAGDPCIGRSRGGLTTKLHLRVIGNGLPVQIELSLGQMNDQPMERECFIEGVGIERFEIALEGGVKGSAPCRSGT